MHFTQACHRHRFGQQQKEETMADKSNRLSENIAGTYYIDSSCIDCDMCRSTAPDFFRRNEEIGMSVVYRQPVTPAEFALAEEARRGCPTESIGNDGITEGAIPGQT
jgi:ferredoxin